MTNKEYAALKVGDEVVSLESIYIHLLKVTRRTPKIAWCGKRRLNPLTIRLATEEDRRRLAEAMKT